MQLRNEELEKITEEAINNNAIVYSKNRIDLIDCFLKSSFRLYHRDVYYNNLRKIGIEYIISDDFTTFDEEYYDEYFFPRKIISKEQRNIVLSKFDELNAVLPDNIKGKDYKEWFFIFKLMNQDSGHYIATIKQEV